MARIPILMPKMSMTMTEGEVSSWLVKVGDRVEVGDVVCEVLTDKVDMEVETTSAGTLVEIVAESGTVAVGEPIGYLEGEDDGLGLGDLLAAQPDTEGIEAGGRETAPTAEPATVMDRPQAGPVAAVPRARGLARERGIELAAVTGTGPDGLVTVADVEQAAVPTHATASATTTTAATPQKDRGAMIRAAVARKMTESAAVPQFTVWRDVVLDPADVVRRRQGVSWTTALLQAYAGALRDVPDLMNRWDAGALDGRGAAAPSGPPAVALAVATEGGLLVPVFVEPDARDARELDAEVKQVVAAAHSGRLDPAYLGIANGSLSNLGGMGVDRFQALVTPPQASVLALGAIKQRPVTVPGGVGLALTLTAGLTVDHRVGDGAHAAGLLDAFVRRLNATDGA